MGRVSYQVQTRYESDGGQLQMVATAISDGKRLIHLANRTIHQGVAIHLTFDSVSFQP